MELLKSQAKTNVKRNRSHRRRTTDRISRVGSVLSDYTKPVIIKRNKDGISSSDDSGHDIIDGKPAIVRVSGDGGSNEDGKLVEQLSKFSLYAFQLSRLHIQVISHSSDCLSESLAKTILSLHCLTTTLLFLFTEQNTAAINSEQKSKYCIILYYKNYNVY